jgi:hypothetical protein
MGHFKQTQIKVTFRTRNTIQNKVNPHSQVDKYEKSGIYQMKYMDCPLKYIGQTSRTFYAGYKNIYKQLGIITLIQDIRNIYWAQDMYMRV